MPAPGDELIAARPLFRALAALFCLLELWAAVGLCGVVINEPPAGSDWLIVLVGFASIVPGVAASGFVAVTGRGPRWLLKWVRARVV